MSETCHRVGRNLPARFIAMFNGLGSLYISTNNSLWLDLSVCTRHCFKITRVLKAFFSSASPSGGVSKDRPPSPRTSGPRPEGVGGGSALGFSRGDDAPSPVVYSQCRSTQPEPRWSERKGGNSERNHEKCRVWKCLPWFIAAHTGVQKKHIFKFNFRCLSDSLFLTLSQLAGKRFRSVEKPGNCEHVRKSLDNAVFLGEMWRQLPCNPDRFSAPKHWRL